MKKLILFFLIISLTLGLCLTLYSCAFTAELYSGWDDEALYESEDGRIVLHGEYGYILYQNVRFPVKIVHFRPTMSARFCLMESIPAASVRRVGRLHFQFEYRTSRDLSTITLRLWGDQTAPELPGYEEGTVLGYKKGAKIVLHATKTGFDPPFPQDPLPDTYDFLPGVTADNRTPLSDMTLPTHSLADLRAVFGQTEGMALSAKDSAVRWSDTHPSFDSPCLRVTRRSYMLPFCVYSVYEVEEGGRYYVFWEKDGEDAKAVWAAYYPRAITFDDIRLIQEYSVPNEEEDAPIYTIEELKSSSIPYEEFWYSDFNKYTNPTKVCCYYIRLCSGETYVYDQSIPLGIGKDKPPFLLQCSLSDDLLTDDDPAYSYLRGILQADLPQP